VKSYNAAGVGGGGGGGQVPVRGVVGRVVYLVDEVCCSSLQCVLQCVMQCDAACCSVCCSVMQCVAVRVAVG